MIHRNIEPLLRSLAGSHPIVTLVGPRQSGKTTLAKSMFPNKPYVSLEDPDTRRFALVDPRGFLSAFTQGAILDEIQRTPELPSYLQTQIDRNDQPGQFILTGSQQFELMTQVSQSLAGRTALLRLLPFTLSEAQRCLKSGVPAKVESAAGAISGGGVLFTLHRPYEIDDSDLFCFPNREAVLVCAVPWHHLEPLLSAVASQQTLSLSAKVLAALRSHNFTDVADATPWFQGFILLPPKQVVRAYCLLDVVQNTSDEDNSHFLHTVVKDVIPTRSIRRDPPLLVTENNDAGTSLVSNPISSPFRRNISSPFRRNENSLFKSFLEQRRSTAVSSLRSPASIQQFLDMMAIIRGVGAGRGLEVVYHFTNPCFASMI
jgi:hypothetical protein